MLWWTLTAAGMWIRWVHLHLSPVLVSVPVPATGSFQFYAVPTALMSFWTFTPLSDVHVSSSLDAVKSWLLLPFHLVGKSCAVNVLLYRTTWGAF